MPKELKNNQREGWVFCRFKRAKAKKGQPDSERKMMDAHDYGYQCWCFPGRRGYKS